MFFSPRQPRRSSASRIALLFACALIPGSACAGTLTADFSTDPGGTALQNRDYSQLIDGGFLKLTPSRAKKKPGFPPGFV